MGTVHLLLTFSSIWRNIRKRPRLSSRLYTPTLLITYCLSFQEPYHSNFLSGSKLSHNQFRESIRCVHGRQSIVCQNITIFSRIACPRDVQRIPHRHRRRIRRTIKHIIRICKRKRRGCSNIRQMLCWSLNTH